MDRTVVIVISVVWTTVVTSALLVDFDVEVAGVIVLVGKDVEIVTPAPWQRL